MENNYPIGGYAPGNYICTCATCKTNFKGDKRAVQCEPCALAGKAEYDALSDDQRAQLDIKNNEAFREIYYQIMSSNGMLKNGQNNTIKADKMVENPHAAK
jgi:hypothetical protein